MSATRTRCRALLLALPLLVVAACGQKAGVQGTEAASGDLGGTDVTVPDGTVTTVGGGAGTTMPASGGTVVPVGGGGGGGAGGTTGTTGGSGTSSGGGTSSATTVAPPSGPGDRTGIGDDVIKIGFHAPVTGAAPVPTESFRRGVAVYWNDVNARGGLFGRKVQIIFRDDQFNPSAAVQACRELVEQEKVFLLIGAAGADQITACAKYANSVGVPYLSLGVNESELSSLSNYFAISMSYRQQSPMLGQLAKKLSKVGKAAIVIENTPTFQDAHASIVSALAAQGVAVVYDKPISKDASQAEILTTSSALRSSGADVVYFLGPPVTFIALAQQGQGQVYTPAYIGPGLSNGLNLVAQPGCPGIGNSRFLSPFPQLDAIDRLDPNYTKAYRAQTGQAPDDLGIAIWGVSKTVHQMMLATGPSISRQSFKAMLLSGRTFTSGVFPPVRYSPSNRFGATSAHLLQADCRGQRFITAATFVSSL